MTEKVVVLCGIIFRFSLTKANTKFSEPMVADISWINLPLLFVHIFNLLVSFWVMWNLPNFLRIYYPYFEFCPTFSWLHHIMCLVFLYNVVIFLQKFKRGKHRSESASHKSQLSSVPQSYMKMVKGVERMPCGELLRRILTNPTLGHVGGGDRCRDIPLED